MREGKTVEFPYDNSSPPLSPHPQRMDPGMASIALLQQRINGCYRHCSIFIKRGIKGSNAKYRELRGKFGVWLVRLLAQAILLLQFSFAHQDR